MNETRVTSTNDQCPMCGTIHPGQLSAELVADHAPSFLERVDRMMAALLSGPTGFERTSGDLAKYALEAIQAVDDVLAAEGVE